MNPADDPVEQSPSGAMPVVSIVGRPNVGKSTLFNRLSRSRRAIVDAVPGITRDRLEMPVEWCGRWFKLVDTGGLDFDDQQVIPRAIVEQVQAAVGQSDAIVFLVDARAGLNPVEREIASLLRRQPAPVLVGANKVDAPSLSAEAAEFHSLGLGDVVPMSAEQGHGLDALLDAILIALPDAPREPEQADQRTRVAVIGRPNVGKSSLVNRLLGEERVIVSDIPGTTRDSVDVRVMLGDEEVLLVDTAGLRRKGSDRDRIDHVARVMAQRAVERADVAVLMLDAVEGVTHQDAVIAGMAVEAGAGLVVLLNKWDLVEEQEARHPEIVREVREGLKFAPWASVTTVSVKTGERLHRLGAEIARVAANRRRRVPTAELNTVLEDAVRRHQPAQPTGEVRLKYLTQIGVRPPRFVAFTGGSAPHFTWQRFLENRLRESFDFAGTPIVLRFRHGRRDRE